MKIAVIGCGKQAPKHIKGLIDNEIEDIVLFDVNLEAAKSLAEQFDLQVIENEDKIFNDSSINAVDICTPVQFHKPFIEKAIASNKHFFCEKPLSSSLQDDEAIAKLAKEQNAIGMLGYIYRFAPALSKAKEIFEGNDLGRLHTAFLRIGGRGNHMEWKHQKASGGGALNEMAVHMIDLAYWYFGEIENIELLEADMRLPKRTIGGKEIICDAEDYLLIKLKSKSGVNVTIMADFVTPAFSQYVEVQGENGSFSGSIQPNYNNNLFLINKTDNYSKGNNPISFKDNNLFKFQMGEFVEAVKSNSQPNKCSLSDSVEVMKAHASLKHQLDSLLKTKQLAS